MKVQASRVRRIERALGSVLDLMAENLEKVAGDDVYADAAHKMALTVGEVAGSMTLLEGSHEIVEDGELAAVTPLKSPVARDGGDLDAS